MPSYRRAGKHDDLMVCRNIAVYANTHKLSIQCLVPATVPFQAIHEKQSETSEGFSILEAVFMYYERDEDFKDFGKAAMYVIEAKDFAHQGGV